MSLFGFLGNMVSGAVKTAVTPLAAAKDVLEGDAEFSSTQDTIGSAIEDAEDAGDEFLDMFDLNS